MTTITSHTIVKNEARFVWFAVASIIDYVDSVLLWDDNSTDGTKKILKELKSKFGKKVELRFLTDSENLDFTQKRRQMLEVTKTDWILMLDADEIWWDRSIRKLTKFIRNKGNKYESVVVPTVNLVGDIYHYQEEAAGKYNLAGRRGHLNLRAINKNIPGLASDKPHGTWGWTDKSGKMIQDRDPQKIKYLETPYLHASFLQRSGFRQGDRDVPKRAKKLKHEIGIPFPTDYYYPEAFFRSRPEIVTSPWKVMGNTFRQRAYIETPLRKINRRIFPDKVGY